MKYPVAFGGSMKKIYRRLTAVFMLIAMLALVSCSGGVSPIKASGDDLNIVANVLGKPIYLEEVRYLTHNFRLDMEAKYGEDISEHEAELVEKIENAMCQNPVLLSLCDEYGIDIEDKETENYVKDYINDFAEQLGGKEEYTKQLEENGITDHHLRYLISIESVKERLRQAMLADGSIDDSDESARDVIESDDFIRTLHVYIGNDAGDDIEANRERAEEVLKKLDGGEPFNRMIGRYSEDVYMTTTDGYYFMRGEYEKAYEDAAFSLAENEYSGVIEGENGFYIILRLPKESEYIEKNFESLKDRYLFVMFEKIIDERAVSGEIEYTEYGKTLDFAKIGLSEAE